MINKEILKDLHPKLKDIDKIRFFVLTEEKDDYDEYQVCGFYSSNYPIKNTFHIMLGEFHDYDFKISFDENGNIVENNDMSEGIFTDESEVKKIVKETLTKRLKNLENRTKTDIIVVKEI